MLTGGGAARASPPAVQAVPTGPYRAFEKYYKQDAHIRPQPSSPGVLGLTLSPSKAPRAALCCGRLCVGSRERRAQLRPHPAIEGDAKRRRGAASGRKKRRVTHSGKSESARFVEESPSQRFRSLKILVYLWHSEILVSTTGCGYAPAPQARLRHRLQHVWGAHISLINEFRISKCCCQCGAILSYIFKGRNKHVILKKPHYRASEKS